MRGRSNRTPKARAEFLDTLRDGWSVTKAAENAGFARRSAYDWRDDDVDFAAAWDEAVEQGTNRLEDEVMRRARDGTEKPVFQMGAQVGSIREYSDRLAEFLLRARKPVQYRDNATVQLTGANGGPIQHETRALDAVESRLAELASRRDETGDPKRLN